METAGTLSSIEFGVHYFHLPVHQLMQYYRCMEHSLHLRAGHVLSHIVPVPTRKTNNTRNEDEDDGLSSDVLHSWALGPHFFLSFLTDMYLYDHMTSTHMTAYLYNRAISSGTPLFPPFVRFSLFSPYGSL